MEDKDREDIEEDVNSIFKIAYLNQKIGFTGNLLIAEKIAAYIIKNFDKKPWLNIPG